MEEKLLVFINQLRKGGVKVSLVETLDCFKALNLISWDKDNFYNTLLATLIKDHEHFPLFNKLFNYYFDLECFFHQPNDNISGKIKLKSDATCTKPLNLDCDSESGGSAGGGAGSGRVSLPVGLFVQTLKLGSQKEFEELIQKGILALGELKETDFINREEAIRKIKVFLQWNMGEYELEKELEAATEIEKLQVQSKLDLLQDMLQNRLDEAFLRKFQLQALEEILKRANLRQLEFFSLSKNQVTEIRNKITQLAHKLSTRVSRREARAKKGKIKLQGTIRKAMSTGGIPIHPVFSGKKPSKPEFILLCDLSGSVKLFSEFMLQLVYSIQSRFLHVRSFAFVDTVHEITDYFQHKDITEGIKEIYYHGKFSKTGFSHYGESFSSFTSQYLELISKKTTVLILGDARNNYQKPNLDQFMEIYKGAYRVFWLNPAPKESWDKDDSIISNYKPYCHRVLECRNLNQLEKVVTQVF